MLLSQLLLQGHQLDTRDAAALRLQRINRRTFLCYSLEQVLSASALVLEPMALLSQC